jgi:hypothetical protein
VKAARSEGEELEQEWARVEAERDNMSDSGTIISIINIQFILWAHAQMRGEGGSCGVSADEYSCTQEPK